MNDAKYIFGDYLATDVQLREFVESIKRRDSDYTADMLTLFENQKLERVRQDREESESAIQRQLAIEQQTQHKDD